MSSHRDRSISRDEKGKEREHSRSNSRVDNDYAPSQERSRTKNIRKEFSNWYVDKNAPLSERMWSTDKRAGNLTTDQRAKDDRKATSVGNARAVRALDREGIAHIDHAYVEKHILHKHSEKKHVYPEGARVEPQSYRDGPKWQYPSVPDRTQRYD